MLALVHLHNVLESRITSPHPNESKSMEATTLELPPTSVSINSERMERSENENGNSNIFCIEEIIEGTQIEEKLFQEAKTLVLMAETSEINLRDQKLGSSEESGFQCACCAGSFGEAEEFQFREFTENTTVLEALSMLLEFPAVVSGKKGLIFGETKNNSGDYHLCFLCGQQISDLWRMFQQFRRMLEKEGRIWRAISGGRSLRSRNSIKEKERVVVSTKNLVSKNRPSRKKDNLAKNLEGKKKKKKKKTKVGGGKKTLKTGRKNASPGKGSNMNLLEKKNEDRTKDSEETLEEFHCQEFPQDLLPPDSNGFNSEPEETEDSNKSPSSSSSKRTRTWKKETWIEKAKTDPSRTCDLCEKSFIFPAVMKRHKKIVHQGLKPYECHSCGKRFTQKVILNKHTCDFSKETDGNRDILQMNREDQLRKFICSVCGKRFKYPTHLNLHEMNHRDERPFPCPQCDKTFRRPDHLKYHVRIVHVDEKKFICTKCGQTFKSISSLRAHEKKHTSETGHLCTICGKSIKSMYQMSRHKKTHQDELPFECPVCGKRFKMKDYLGQHLRRGKTCSKKLPSIDIKDSSNGISFVNNSFSQIGPIPVSEDGSVLSSSNNKVTILSCNRNFNGPVVSESDIVTLEFSNCFPAVDERLLTEL